MNYKDYYLNSDQAEEIIENGGECYVVFEEDSLKPKGHDLTQGIFENLDSARQFVGANNHKEPLYIAKYSEYISGNYDYI
jgi:hypothetical protein